jgi:hypothetical protein
MLRGRPHIYSYTVEQLALTSEGSAKGSHRRDRPAAQPPDRHAPNPGGQSTRESDFKYVLSVNHLVCKPDQLCTKQVMIVIRATLAGLRQAGHRRERRDRRPRAGQAARRHRLCGVGQGGVSSPTDSPPPPHSSIQIITNFREFIYSLPSPPAGNPPAESAPARLPPRGIPPRNPPAAFGQAQI